MSRPLAVNNDLSLTPASPCVKPWVRRTEEDEEEKKTTLLTAFSKQKNPALTTLIKLCIVMPMWTPCVCGLMLLAVVFQWGVIPESLAASWSGGQGGVYCLNVKMEIPRLIPEWSTEPDILSPLQTCLDEWLFPHFAPSFPSDADLGASWKKEEGGGRGGGRACRINPSSVFSSAMNANRARL